jgi:hypothetical protein
MGVNLEKLKQKNGLENWYKYKLYRA